jgi:uncharacterized protein (DUF433 family)
MSCSKLLAITTNPAIMNGRPCFGGTRVTIRSVALQLRLGVTPEELQRELPYLDLASLRVLAHVLTEVER